MLNSFRLLSFVLIVQLVFLVNAGIARAEETSGLLPIGVGGDQEPPPPPAQCCTQAKDDKGTLLPSCNPQQPAGGCGKYTTEQGGGDIPCEYCEVRADKCICKWNGCKWESRVLSAGCGCRSTSVRNGRCGTLSEGTNPVPPDAFTPPNCADKCSLKDRNDKKWKCGAPAQSCNAGSGIEPPVPCPTVKPVPLPIGGEAERTF